MKSLFPAMAVAGLLGLTSLGAHATDGQLKFVGKVTSSTCSINGQATPYNKTVTLPTVSISSLKGGTSGTYAGMSAPADLQFQLTGCGGTATKALAKWQNDAAMVEQTKGTLKNLATTGAADGVTVQLRNSGLNPINIATGAYNDLSSDGATLVSGAATLQYYASYYAAANTPTTAGTVNAQASFTLQYQ